jgi:hypothetical protein
MSIYPSTRLGAGTWGEIDHHVTQEGFSRILGQGHVAFPLTELNPFGYFVWGYLESKLSPSPHKSLDATNDALAKEWNKIGPDYLRPTIESITTRLKACIQAK